MPRRSRPALDIARGRRPLPPEPGQLPYSFSDVRRTSRLSGRRSRSARACCYPAPPHSCPLFPWDGRDLASDGGAVDGNILAKTLLFAGSQGATATEGRELGPLIASARGPGRALDVNVRRLVVAGVDIYLQPEVLGKRLCDSDPRDRKVEDDVDRDWATAYVAKEKFCGVLSDGEAVQDKCLNRHEGRRLPLSVIEVRGTPFAEVAVAWTLGGHPGMDSRSVAIPPPFGGGRSGRRSSVATLRPSP